MIPGIALAVIAASLAWAGLRVVLNFRTRATSHRARLLRPVAAFAATLGCLVGILLTQAVLLALGRPWPVAASIGYVAVTCLFIGCLVWLNRVTRALPTASLAE